MQKTTKKQPGDTRGCIAFTGGGTGGHIYPGLAVVQELRTMTLGKIIWIGSSRGIDRRLVETDGSVDAFYGISSGKLRRYFSWQNFTDFFRIIYGFFSSLCILAKNKPEALFSKGGFVSVPPCYAAKILRIPVFTHECDFSPGLATKLNSKVADTVFVTYEQTARFFKESLQKKIVVSGNPVRTAFYNANRQAGLQFLGLSEQKSKPLLLVIGGSLGAQQINGLVWQSLDWLTERFVVVHQTGAGDFSSAPTHDNYYPYNFIYDRMADVVAAADVILSRAGANSLWESIVTGKPMVLIPLSGAGTRGDQIENARFLQQHGAAIMLDGNTVSAQDMQEALKAMVDTQKRAEFAAAALALKNVEPPARLIAKKLSAFLNSEV